MGRRLRWSQHEGGPLAHAVGAPVVPKRREPSRRCGRGLGGPKANAALTPLRRRPRWSQSEGGPHAHAAGALVVTIKGGALANAAGVP